MKKKIIGLSVCVLALSGMAAIAGGALLGNQNAIEANARPDGTADILLYSNDNNWLEPWDQSAADPYYFTYTHTKDGSHYYQLTLDMTRDTKFMIKDFEHGDQNMKSYDGTKALQGLINDGDGNLRCTMTGNYTITYRYTSEGNRCIEGFELNNATEMYFVRNPSAGSWTSPTIYLHAWTDSGDLTYGKWSAPLNPVPAIDFGSSDLDFYRFQIPNNATGFMVKGASDDTDWKTGDLTRSAGTCYTVSGSADDGAAGALVGEIYSGLGTFTNAQSQSFENSICAINATQRASIASAYGSLGETAKATFEASTLNTYNGNNLSGSKVDVTFKEIVDQLAVNTTNGLAAFSTFNSPSNAVVLVSAIVGLGLVAAGFVTLLAKKKEQ